MDREDRDTRKVTVHEPRWLRILAVGALATVGYFVVPVSADVQEWWYAVIGLAATLLVVVAIRHRPLFRPQAWWWLAGALALSMLGDVTWIVYDNLGIEPFPSVADAFYLASYPLFALSLWTLGRRDRRDVGSLIDACIIAVSASVVAWIYLLAPYIEDTSLTPLERAISLAYPIGDLVLVPLLVRLVLTHGARVRAHLLLLVAVSVYFAADVTYVVVLLNSEYVAGGLIDGGWLLAYVLFAAAAWHPSAEDHPEAAPPEVTLSSRRLALLAAASILAPMMLLIHDTGTGSIARVTAGASIVMFLLVLQRMNGLIRQVRAQSRQLDQLARTDALTGAANRRELDAVLADAVANGERHGEGPAVAMLDLDHFKAYNDEFGHPAGDRFLRTTVAAWQRELRAIDLLARYGGEEFVVVLPRCGPEEAHVAVERLRRAVPEGRTCSAGIAVWAPGMGVGDLIDVADRAAYEAKRRGRDCSVVDQPV